MLKIFSMAAIAVSLLMSAPQATAAQLTSLKVEESARIQAIQPSWKTPKDRGQLFYLQRSMNSNTVVYRVNFDGNGNIKANDPVTVYWRRFNSDGAAKPLKTIEHLAYGLRTKNTGNGTFTMTLKRLPQIPMTLRQTGPGKAELTVKIGGKTARAVYAYATLEGSGISQRVSGFSIHGIDPATGRAIKETYAVKGGAIKP